MPSTIKSVNNLTDEQLSAISILLEVGVSEVYLMPFKTVVSNVKKAADNMGVNVEQALLKVGAHIFLFNNKENVTKLVKILGLK